MPTLEIIGQASGTSRLIDYTSDDLKTNLLAWLRSQGVTVASSCDGKGVCKKCVIQNDWITCELTLQTFLEICPEGKIYIGYL